MTGFLSKATAAVALGAATLAVTAAPAEARRYHNDRYYRHGDRTGTAIAAGVVGLAIGAAIASSSRDRYRDRYYDRGYRYDGYRSHYRGQRYRGCYTRRVYDPYIGRRVRVRFCD